MRDKIIEVINRVMNIVDCDETWEANYGCKPYQEVIANKILEVVEKECADCSLDKSEKIVRKARCGYIKADSIEICDRCYGQLDSCTTCKGKGWVSK